MKRRQCGEQWRKILEKLNSKQNTQVQYKGKTLRKGKSEMKRETISLTKTAKKITIGSPLNFLCLARIPRQIYKMIPKILIPFFPVFIKILGYLLCGKLSTFLQLQVLTKKVHYKQAWSISILHRIFTTRDSIWYCIHLCETTLFRLLRLHNLLNRRVLPEEGSERESQWVDSRIKFTVELAKIKALLSCKSCSILSCKEDWSCNAIILKLINLTELIRTIIINSF